MGIPGGSEGGQVDAVAAPDVTDGPALQITEARQGLAHHVDTGFLVVVERDTVP